KEIAADLDWKIIKLYHIVLGWLFRTIFVQLYINEESVVKIRELAKRYPIIYIPNHRSHLDYLMVGYALCSYQMAIPHVAAGINMNFFPLGYFFRKGGAFFLRRSFKGNKV